MLISSSSYDEMWTEAGEDSTKAQQAGGKKKTTLDKLLKSNVKRYLRMVENPAMQDKIGLYLTSQQLDMQYKFDPFRSQEEHLVVLQAFADWFRHIFPYYYGQCLQCGDRAAASYLGALHPTALEKAHGQAGRVELYACGKCGAYSRFPRFIDVSQVLSTCRGRCGEYSMLCLVMLRRLGYQARWVIDRDDHVWVEVKVASQWTHLDPCEASIGNPTLYEDWGKQPTFVLAFDHDLEGEAAGSVVDVTDVYVRDAGGVRTRRVEEGMEEEVVRRIITQAQTELMQGVQTVRKGGCSVPSRSQ